MSPRDKENTERINVFLSESVLGMVREEAAEKGMTVSGIIRMIVMEYFSTRK